MPIPVKVDGLAELKANLAELSKATQRRVQQRVLLKRAQPIVAAAKAKAPVDQGDLRNSIHATTKRPKGHKTPSARAFAATRGAGGTAGQARAAAKAAGSAPVEVFIGPGRHPQATQQEFGNKNHVPQPYMRPAWDENKKAMLDGIGKDMGDEIKRTAERARRRQARRATR
jgi:HK97 gp10 family phage protein